MYLWMCMFVKTLITMLHVVLCVEENLREYLQVKYASMCWLTITHSQSSAPFMWPVQKGLII